MQSDWVAHTGGENLMTASIGIVPIDSGADLRLYPRSPGTRCRHTGSRRSGRTAGCESIRTVKPFDERFALSRITIRENVDDPVLPAAAFVAGSGGLCALAAIGEQDLAVVAGE